jgi:hypothetical protein
MEKARWSLTKQGNFPRSTVEGGTALTNHIPPISQKPALEPGLHDSADQFFCLPANPTGLVDWLGDSFPAKRGRLKCGVRAF